ncbi:UDP-glucuronate:xylan alpha-glucuronosyltransferase 1 [Galdieria sulphuraria]|nr:UDP-glucuronate:xylan alpha-glucuronosyltransferase 1 [Galdieria sulphuraria]
MKAAKVASAIRASYSPRKEELGSKCITVDTLCQLRAWNYRKCRAKVAIATLVTATFYVPGALTLLKSFQVTDRVEASEVRYLKQAGWLIKHVHRLPVLGCSEEDLVLLLLLIGIWTNDVSIRTTSMLVPVNGFAEQDFLNDYYARDIYQIWSGFHVGMTWLHPGCNALKFVYVDSSQVWNSIYDTICIVHYAHKKPWKLLKNTSCLHVGLSYEPDERRDCFENSKCWILHDYWHIIRAMPQDHREFPFPPRAVPDSYNPLQEYRRLDQVIERYIPKADKSEVLKSSIMMLQCTF